VIQRHRILLILIATLAGAAWINAAQERKACGTCSPVSSSLTQLACELKLR
jgi:hypothetical protein